MQIKELLAESLELKPGNIIDLTRNYPQYTRLLGRVESISSKGTKYQILIVKADSQVKNPPYREGQTLTIAGNYLRRCPVVAESKQRLDPKCWKGYKKQGTKIKGGVKVNNCVKTNESVEYTLQIKGRPVMKYQHQSDAEQAMLDLKQKFPKQDIQVVQTVCKDTPVAEDWQKVNRKDKTDGMSNKAVKAYRRENPGSNLKTAVTKKPSEIKKGSSDDKRRKSFCARMSGVEGPMKKPNGEPTNKAKALKRWNC